MKPSSIRGLAALVAATALVAAACGGDDGGASAGATTAAPASGATTAAPSAQTTAAPATGSDTTAAPSAPTGEPIKIMTTGPVESPVFSLPSIPVGAQVAVDEINAAGGIDGRPLELVTCNDEANPNTAAKCIKQAADDDVVALVGGLSLFEPVLLPLLEAEKIAWVGLSSGAVFSAPNLFPIADGVTAFAGIGAAAAQGGCTNAAVVLSASATPTNGPAIAAGLTASGAKVATELKAPQGSDWAPVVQSAIAEGADCIASGVSPAEVGPLLAAVAGRLPVYTVDGSLPEVLLQGIGAGADGTVAVAGFLPPSSGDAKVADLVAKSKAISPDVSLDQFWYSGYAAVGLVAEALRAAAEPTAENVLAGLPKISGFDTQVGPVIDFTKKNGVAGYDSIYNPKVYVLKAEGGAWAMVQPDPIDLTAAIQQLGKQ